MDIKRIWNYAIDENLSMPHGRTYTRGHDVCRMYYDPEKDELIIAFNGSDDIKDWISNLRAVRDEGLHDGFGDSVRQFYEIIDPFLLSFYCSKVICTGHSRGAAIATLMAGHIAKGLGADRDINCIAFASPRVFSRNRARKYEALPIKHFVIRNGRDIVTHLPGRALGFRHVGRLLKLKTPWYRFFLTSRIRDHFASAYAKRLKKERDIHV